MHFVKESDLSLINIIWLLYT